MLTFILGMSAKAQQRNVLLVPDVTTQTGNVQLPVSIENTDEIAGAQFEITLPDGMTASAIGTLTSRSDGHTVTVNRLASGAYRVLLHSTENRLLHGQSGVVMYLPVTIPTSFQEDSDHPLTITNAVLAKATGENVLTEAVAGTIHISKLPDLTVRNINCDKQRITPGERITVSWQVANIGELATGGGWSEQVSLVASDGTQSKLIATTYYDDILGANGVVSRQAEITLPVLLGLDGQTRLQVHLVPNSKTGESPSAQGNNTQEWNSLITINKVLNLELSPKRIIENSSQRIAFRLNRSGSWATAETFNISARKDSRLSVPTSITIPVGQSGTVIYLTPTDNNVLDNDSVITISAEGNGYQKVSDQLIIEDNEYPNLTLSSSKSVVNEGESFQLTISTSRASSQPVTVTLTSENTKRFSFPQTVTIPAGKNSTTATVQAVDDDLPSLELSNVFTVSAPKYNKAETIVLLKDNDLPVLELTLNPSTVSEGAGVVSVAGILRRTTHTDSKITVKLSDDANGGLYISNRTLVLSKGVEEVNFNFGPVDNAQVDGDRTYTVTASVWLSSCSCSAAGESAGNVSAQLQVLDDDGPSLTLTSSLGTIKEGGKATLTISRNTTNNSRPVTVTISSDHEDGLSYQHTVKIPAGQQSVTTEVTSSENDIQGDSRTIVFTAKADGYASGTCYVLLTDQTLPDAVIEDIAVVDSEVEAGGKATISVSLANRGSAELPSHAQIDIYLQNNTIPFGTMYTQSAITPGENTTITSKITMPQMVGSQQIYAIVNDSRSIIELQYTNNTSENVEIQLLSPYTATVTCDKHTYLPGETITMTGVVQGRLKANSAVEIYLINDGVRQSFTAQTDNTGQFTSSYTPHERQMGHFSIGACYPNSGQTTEQDAFEYIGLRRTSQSYITCDVIVGTPYQGTIQIENPTNVTQHNIKTEVIEIPENCEIAITPISSMASGEKRELNYTIIGKSPSEQSEWKSIRVRLVSDEGASTEITLYSHCRLAQAQLSLDITQLNTTVTKGVPRDYPITITNIGAGETGQITLSVPSILQGTPVTHVPSLQPNESTTISLHLETTEEMKLNVPVTGTIGINCENGNGISLPFRLLPVSETSGTLIVDVCDEYTYYTTEAPHVKGAKITLKHPYSDQVIVEGVTGDDGTFSTELSEGYYSLSITADKHESYRNNIMIDPGCETRKVINLSYEAITVNWDVEETEVEDEYDIKTTLTYETNVPAPVVVTTLPEYIPIDSMAPGESRIYYATLTNKGLIAAEGVQLQIPNVEYVTFESLIEFPIRLLPEQSVSVPFKVTLSENVVAEDEEESAANRMGPRKVRRWKVVCSTTPKTIWFHWCGNDHTYKHHNTGLPLTVLDKCHVVTIERKDDPVEPIGVPNGSGGFIWIGGSGGGSPTVSEDKGCKTCVELLLKKLREEVIKRIPYVGGYIYTAICMKESFDRAKTGVVKIPDMNVMACESYAMEQLATSISGVGEGLKLISNVIQILAHLSDFKECFWISLEPIAGAARKVITDADIPSFVIEMDGYNKRLIRQLEAFLNINLELYGDEVWLDADISELLTFINALSERSDNYLVEDEMKPFAPTNISDSQLHTFVCRMNNSFWAAGHEEGGIIDFDKIEEYIQTILSEEQQAQTIGYSSFMDLWMTEYEKYKERLQEGSNSVCASITLQIDQTMTMSRPAYRGTLTVFNGNEDTAMTDVRLNLEVKDENGNAATAHEFQINAEKLEGFEGEMSLPGGWTLDAQQTGKATVLFIPTKYATPTVEKVYSFGGTLSYIDPFTGLEVTRNLLPVSLEVKPLPNLELTYLMQRDVYGDDPLTKDRVEPMQPAEFALIINNKGYSDAKNVRMQTEQPEIIDNEKGLLIDFSIKSSQVNGESANLSFGKAITNNFGTIPAQSQAYAQWWIESSLLGHFTSYEVEATHVTSYGNEDLSLLDNITIHEMVHGFTLNTLHPKLGTPLRGYLVNDIVDADDQPDVVYFTDAAQQEVFMAKSAIITRQSDKEYVLKVTAHHAGWNYGSLLDPTNGRQRLVKVVRSDGTELNVDNVWQTDRTLRDSREWLYENRLHFVGNMSAAGETFYLTFEPKPDVELTVDNFIGIPDEGTVLKQQLTVVSVKFSKPIKTNSFTTDDISLTCQGIALDASKIVIEKVSDYEFRLKLNNVTLSDGYYVLTVQTAAIIDYEGFNGSEGKQVAWIQYVDGKVPLKVTILPANGGTTTPGSGRYEYDSDVKLKAKPTEGYDFAGWMEGETILTTDKELTYHLVTESELKALFTIKHYSVAIDYDPVQGFVEGAATGIYEHGTELRMVAVPYEGYDFDAWTINHERKSNERAFTLFVNSDMDINALFREHTPTDIQSVDDEVTHINITPLPLRDYMYITGNVSEIRYMGIYDMRGIKVLGANNLQLGQNVYVGGLGKGIYYIQVATDRGVYSVKVMKR